MAFLVLQQIVRGAGHTLHDVHDRTLRQNAVPPALLARADAGIRSVGHASMMAVLASAAAALLAVLTLARRLGWRPQVCPVA